MACRGKAARAFGLVRLVVSDGAIVVDPAASRPGRGAWVHATPDCLERIERERGRLRHALRTEVGLQAPLVPQIRALLLGTTRAGLARAAASGCLVSGAHDLTAALIADRITALAVASDASERSVAALTAAAPVPWVRVDLDRKALGAIVHRGPRAAVGATRSTASNHLVSQLHMLRSLG